ncbi:TrbL/VirB6 plasmid conjugal transfer protein [compost metagenome]
MAISVEIVAPLYDSIDASLQSTLATGTAQVIAGLGLLYGALWTLQFTVKTLIWWWQGLGVAIQDIVMSTIRMAAVCACAFNVGWYINTIVPFVNEFPAWVSGHLTDGAAAGEQVNQVDNLISSYLNLVIEYATTMKFNPFYEDLAVVLKSVLGLAFILMGGVPFLGVAVATLITLKVATMALLVLGPVFIAFLLFDQTRQWFWGWVSTLAGFMLTQVLFVAILALEMNYIQTSILDVGADVVSWKTILSILLVFNAFAVIAVALPNIASSVMGGGAIPTATAGGIMGKTLGAATGWGAAKKMATFFAASRLLTRNRMS